MKSLYESITCSRFTRREIDESIIDNDEKVIKDVGINTIKHLILNPKDHVELLNKIWNELDLAFDGGYGEGYWKEQDRNKALYVVPMKINGLDYTTPILFVGSGYASNIVVTHTANKIKKNTLKKFAEKISRMLNMNMLIERLYIYLNF